MATVKKDTGKDNVNERTEKQVEKVDTTTIKKWLKWILGGILGIAIIWLSVRYISNKNDSTTDNRTTVSATEDPHLQPRSFALTSEYPSAPQWNEVRGLHFLYDTGDYVMIRDAAGNEYKCGPDGVDPIPDTELNRKLWFKVYKGSSGNISIYNIIYK